KRNIPRADAEDLAQHTLAVIWQHRAYITQRANPLAYALALFKHARAQYHRAQQKQAATLLSLDAGAETQEPGYVPPLDQSVQADQARRRLDQWQALLSERERRVLALRRHGLTTKAIAQELATTDDSIRQVLVRLKEKLRRHAAPRTRTIGNG